MDPKKEEAVTGKAEAPKPQKFAYIGDCAEGEVKFTVASREIVMPKDELVLVPATLAAKLASNSHFVDEEGLKKRQAEVDKSKKDKAAKSSAATAGA